MSITVKTRKMLWGRSASRCSFPDCRLELVMDETETDDPSIVGEECHIIAREDDGPRGNSDFPVDKRDNYDNLILLCNVHHKNVDDQEKTFTIEKLKDMKKKHEEWVSNTLNTDKDKIKDELIYSNYIDEWVKKADLDNWKGWTSHLLSSDEPSIYKETLNDLEMLKDWLFTRIMPKRYGELDNSFENFRLVLSDLIRTFKLHYIEIGDIVVTDKFYKISHWNSATYNKLHNDYMFHVDLIMDLTLELTRAANLICDQIRKYILPNFRINEGMLVVESGPFMDLTFKTFKVYYNVEQKKGLPYKNLTTFKQERKNRDIHFGEGVDYADSIKLGHQYE